MAKYDWDKIRADYVNGLNDEEGSRYYPSYKDLADKYGASERTIRTRGAKEKWSQDRDIFKTRLSQSVSDKKVEAISDEAVKFDSLNLQVSTLGLERCKKILEDPETTNHDVNKISGAVLNYQREGKIALGEPVEKTENTEKGGKADELRYLPVPEDPILRGEASAILSKVLSG